MRHSRRRFRSCFSRRRVAATATDTEADWLNRAATTGSPADPTFGAEAVSANSALSRRSVPNSRIWMTNTAAKMISIPTTKASATLAWRTMASRGVCAMAINSAAGNAKFMTSALSEPMFRLSISLVRPATKPRTITKNNGAREASMVSIILRSIHVRRVDVAIADRIEENLSNASIRKAPDERCWSRSCLPSLSECWPSRQGIAPAVVWRPSPASRFASHPCVTPSPVPITNEIGTATIAFSELKPVIALIVNAPGSRLR